jgi:hypothetical protein
MLSSCCLSGAARLVPVGALFALAGSLIAADPFSIHVQEITPAGDGLTGVVSGSNFLDVMEEAIEANTVLAAFDQLSYNADLTYLGVEEAISFILFDGMGTGAEATLFIPSIDFQRDFGGPGYTRDQLSDEIDDFFETEGSSVVGEFLAAMAKQSVVMPTDGNPNAATNQRADDRIQQDGFTDVAELFVEDAAADSGGGRRNFSGFGLGFNSGRFEAGDLEGTKTIVSIPFRIALSDRVALSGAVPFEYLTVEDASIYGVGLTLGLPIKLMAMDAEKRLNWRVTPAVGVSARGSVDLASGGAMFEYGVTNTLDYRINKRVIICMVNQVTGYQSFSVEYDEYEFDPNIKQLILKNGLRGVYRFTNRLIGDVFFLDTRFTEDAAVDQFFTLGGSLGYKLTRKASLRVGFNYDTGDDFKAWSVGLSSAWKF